MPEGLQSRARKTIVNLPGVAYSRYLPARLSMASCRTAFAELCSVFPWDIPKHIIPLLPPSLVVLLPAPGPGRSPRTAAVSGRWA